MASKLAVFGCSWAYGSELVDPDIASEITDSYHGLGSDFDRANHAYRLDHCFGKLLANNFELDFVNLAQPGNSNFGILNNLSEFVDTNNIKDFMCVFAMTDSNRYSWYCDDKFEHSSWIQWQRDHKMHASFRNWLTHTNSSNWQTQTENLITRSIVSICDANGIPFVMFDCLPRAGQIKHSNYMWPGHCFKKDLEHNNKSKFLYQGGHPTEAGHARIAEILVDFVTSKSLL